MTAEVNRLGNDWAVAVHEAGHCLGARLAGSQVTLATIEGGRGSDGRIRSTTMQWEKSIIELLLGHAAELEFGIQEPRGWGGHFKDYEQAAKRLRDMMKFKRHGVEMYSQKKVRIAKAEWKPAFDRYVRKARRLARKHRGFIERMALLLVTERTLSDSDIPRLGES